MPAKQSGSQRQQCIGAISAFVDSIDSHIILRMIRESKSTKAMVQIACERLPSSVKKSDTFEIFTQMLLMTNT